MPSEIPRKFPTDFPVAIHLIGGLTNQLEDMQNQIRRKSLENFPGISDGF